MGKFSRSCQAMLRKSYQNNNIWGLLKWKPGRESIENDNRFQEADIHRSIKSYQEAYMLMIVHLARIQRMRSST